VDFITEFWEQLTVLGIAILALVKMKFEVDSLKKDVSDLRSRSTFVDVIELKAKMTVVDRNITELWSQFNANEKRK
tara:strand:- start:350 stop:577 length:228 start_codon:yes stop_codon:yes gene_type:complete